MSYADKRGLEVLASWGRVGGWRLAALSASGAVVGGLIEGLTTAILFGLVTYVFFRPVDRTSPRAVSQEHTLLVQLCLADKWVTVAEVKTLHEAMEASSAVRGEVVGELRVVDRHGTLLVYSPRRDLANNQEGEVSGE